MKKYFVLFGLVFVFVFRGTSWAYQQSEGTCYSQCLAYRFVWQGTYCYDVFADNCTEEKGNTIVKTISFLKSVYDVVKSGDNIDVPFKAMFVCKPLIESCIVPNQNDCKQTCGVDQYVYAPDLSVGHRESSFHGVYYDEKTKQLYFKLVNNGMGYAWNIEVEASSGHTPNRDGMMSNEQQLFKEKVEHLIYVGARNGPPKSFSDSVGDFLIEESLNGQYLHNFKSWVVSSLDLHSDSKNYNVPNYWIKAVSYNPIPGELNRITFKVDPSQVIPEVYENNNTFVLEIDLRPAPARYEVTTLTKKIVEDTLDSFLVNFQVKNTGEESGVAKVKIYDGKYTEDKAPVYQTEGNILGKNYKDFETTVVVNPSTDPNLYCGKLKEYTLVVGDQEGNQSQRSFWLPIYLGSVNGRVDDILGKRVKMATIKADSGQETQSSDIGYFHLKGINRLGKQIIKATHSEYSKADTRQIEFKFGDEFKACKEGYLLFNSVNFVLKDQDVLFRVTIKDTAGNLVNGHVLAVNTDFRKEVDINGSGPMPELQPGRYQFVVSAPGYKTIRQDVNAVPENNNLEFVLEKIGGRLDDNGLHLVTPKLLWKKNLGTGERLIGNMVGSKNGQLLVVSVGDNKSKTRDLHFLDFVSGNQINIVPVPYSVEQMRYVGLDTSYNGETVGLYVNPGMGATDHEGIVKVFNASGNELGTTTLDKKNAISMEVSPDGFYVCPYLLLDKGLHKYTQHETKGKGDDNFERNAANCGDYFLRNNNYIDDCGGNLCEKTISGQQVRTIGNISEHTAATKYDSSSNDSTVVVRTHKKLYYFGQSSWSKELESDNDFKSVAISNGGTYAMTTVGDGSDKMLGLKVFDSGGVEKTPSFPYKNVRFVFANDKGMYFAQIKLNQVEFYQIGEYASEYNLGKNTPTPVPDWINGISIYSRGQFTPVYNKRYASLDPGTIYRADVSIKFNIVKPFTNSSLGILSITKDSLFAVDSNHDPVLIKGQMTANFDSPATVYAIKFDRYWSGLFEEKLSKFIHHQLPEDEYFVIQNIHTKFRLVNGEGKFNAAAEEGEVLITSKNVKETILGGKQITIDKDNKINRSGYLGSKIYTILLGGVLLVGGLGYMLKKVRGF